MRELRTRLQRLIFGLSALFVILILALANGFALWQASQTVQYSLDSTSRLYDTRGHDNEVDILSQLPVCTVLLNRDGTVSAVLARDAMMDEDDLLEAVRSGLDSGQGFLYTARYQSRREGNVVTIVDTSQIARHLREVLGASAAAAILILAALWFGVRRLVQVMTQPIEDNMERQVRFIADASHELKTPLAVIQASAEAMEQDPQDKWLQAILTESGQMNRLITGLLDLSRSELEPEPADVDLSHAIEHAALPFESLLYERGLGLKLELEPDLHIAGSEPDLERLAGILIDNASRHADPGTDVTVRLTSRKGRILLSVEDIGDPIGAGEEEKIFARFYRADAARNRAEGRYGLGLAIAKNIVARHQGTICAWSRDGKTVFEASLPSSHAK